MPGLGDTPSSTTGSNLSALGYPNLPYVHNPLFQQMSSSALSSSYLPQMTPTQSDAFYPSHMLLPHIAPAFLSLLAQRGQNVMPYIYNAIQSTLETQEKVRQMQERILNGSAYTSQLSSPYSPNNSTFDSQTSPTAKRAKKRSSRSPLPCRASSLSPTTFLTPSSMVSSTTLSNGDSEEYSPNSGPSPSSSEESRLRVDELPQMLNDATPVRKRRAKAPGVAEKRFKCGECFKTFGYKHVLQNHQRTHTGEKPYSCRVCDKKFTRDHHLKTHMRLHTGEKPYLCQICHKDFVQVANLRRHQRVHTGEKPYPCDVCDSKFSDSNQLKSHRSVHSGEKPFPCQGCGVKFRRRNHLNRHKCPSRSPGTSNPLEHQVNGLPAAPQLSPMLNLDDMTFNGEGNQLVNSLLQVHGQPSSPIREDKRRDRKPRLPIRFIPRNEIVQTEPEDLSMPAKGVNNICIAKVELRPSLPSSHLMYSDSINKSGDIIKEA